MHAGRSGAVGGGVATVQGPPGLIVADAEVDEAAENAALAFAVTLGPAASGAVTVAYATSNGTAVAPGDYTATSGTLTFATGETAKTVSVPVHGDALDEGSETLTLTLSDPSGAFLADAEAVGTIRNSGPIPQAWIARFGRTVADQAVTPWTFGCGMRGRRGPRRRSPVTGSRPAPRPGRGRAPGAGRDIHAEALGAWLRGRDGTAERETLSGARSLSALDLFRGSSFALTRGLRTGGRSRPGPGHGNAFRRTRRRISPSTARSGI